MQVARWSGASTETFASGSGEPPGCPAQHARGGADEERFLMADVYSFQVREYAVDGLLLVAAGRRGGGPGEYLAPMRASRALDGGIRVIDGPAMRSTYYPSRRSARP